MNFPEQFNLKYSLKHSENINQLEGMAAEALNDRYVQQLFIRNDIADRPTQKKFIVDYLRGRLTTLRKAEKLAKSSPEERQNQNRQKAINNGIYNVSVFPCIIVKQLILLFITSRCANQELLPLSIIRRNSSSSTPYPIVSSSWKKGTCQKKSLLMMATRILEDDLRIDLKS